MTLLIGVDAGATKIRAAVADGTGRLVAHLEGPGVNVAGAGVAVAADRVAGLVEPALRGHGVAGLVVGIAGAWSPRLSRPLDRALRERLRPRTCRVLNDAAAVLAAEVPAGTGLLLAVGTGVVAVGAAPGRPLVRVDGWGPLAGDAGGGAWIGRRALAAALAIHDGRRSGRRFARAVLHAARLRDPGRDIHRWYGPEGRPGATAALAPVVIRLARAGDPVARRLVAEASAELAATVAAALRRLSRGPVRLLVTGGLAAAAPELLAELRRLVRQHPGRLRIEAGGVPPEAACLKLAARLVGGAGLERALGPAMARFGRSRPRRSRVAGEAALPVTERRNPATTGFSEWSPLARVRAMNSEDARVAPAVARVLPAIARAVEVTTDRMRRGGRLIYAGAGTSGRLGVLDASEVPPTFGLPAGRVVGLIAGGRRALTDSIEGAEDSAALGAAAIRHLRVGRRDVVVGLSAGGGAAWTLGAVTAARRRGAATVGITCNPAGRLAHATGIAIVPVVGPEAIAGSSRLKAGTAQKMVLNMLSTCVMAGLGRVAGNLMSAVRPANAKLRERAVRIAAARVGLAPADLRRRLAGAGAGDAAFAARFERIMGRSPRVFARAVGLR